MRRILALAALACAAACATGCGSTNKTIAGIAGFSRYCVEGVSYLQFSSGASVEYKPDGKIKTCG